MNPESALGLGEIIRSEVMNGTTNDEAIACSQSTVRSSSAGSTSWIVAPSDSVEWSRA
jgi:hypothetical protein